MPQKIGDSNRFSKMMKNHFSSIMFSKKHVEREACEKQELRWKKGKRAFYEFFVVFKKILNPKKAKYLSWFQNFLYIFIQWNLRNIDFKIQDICWRYFSPGYSWRALSETLKFISTEKSFSHYLKSNLLFRINLSEVFSL